MVNKENYFQEYTVHAKYQTVSAKAVVQVDFPAYALSKQTPLKKQKGKKCKQKGSKQCHFVKIKLYGIKLLHANIPCVNIVHA